MARKKPAAKKRAKRKPAVKAARPAAAVDASPQLARLGFFRGEYHWETDRDVLALEACLRLNVDHIDGRVTPEQVRAVELLFDTKKPLRPPAIQAAYQLMLEWVDGYRQRHPGFRGKPIAERPFARGCELRTVLFPTPPPGEKKPAPTFVLSLFWPDDNRPCDVRFERKKSGWKVTQCERN